LLQSMKIVWLNFVTEGGDKEAEIPWKLKLFVSPILVTGTNEFCWRMIILATCGLHAYSDDSAEITNEITKFMSLEQVNSQWTDVSQASIGPHSICEIENVRLHITGCA
jgi:hypothetical protein